MVVEQRRQLKARARERHAEMIPRLREAVKAARARKRARLRSCRDHCADRRRKLKADAQRARLELRERIRAARDAARHACTTCRTTATEEGLEQIDSALAAVAAEREAIAELRRRAARLKSGRGAAGGRRTAELRAESDDAVRRDLDGDPLLLAVWERVKGGNEYRSRTEAFLELVHDAPELLDEERSRQERRWEAEAEQAFKALAKRKPSRVPAAELDRWARELDEADKVLLTGPVSSAPVPF